MRVETADAVRPETPVPSGASPALRRGLWVATGVAMLVLAWAAFLLAPEDLEQGAPQRIFYIHVPSAWVGFLAFGVVFVSSIAFLATGRRRWDELAAASAEVGVVFTIAVLITGPLWARPIWGVFWSWDPRLTSYLILFLLYVSYLVLRGYVPDPERKARFSAVLGIVGFLDVPIVYLSVRWWRALHPEPIVITSDGPQMPGEMLLALMVGLAAFSLLYVALLVSRLRVGRLEEAREQEGWE